ncbi:MAG: cytochrome c oxidase accessory protein CcoG [Cyclobacteriaceae bacterium]
MEVQKENNFYAYDEEFRNTIATVDEKGKRVWLHPKKPSGTYHTRRIWVTIFLLSIFFSGPFIKLNGQPLLLLNVFERRFVLFGQPFWPQDFFLLALTLITFFVFIILFTVSLGRLWCGWACPQTLFMEMVFRKIEYWIEGDAPAQRRLKAAPWTAEKILKKGSKQLIFITISTLIAHVAMSYLIGIEQVKTIISQPPSAHFAGFVGLVAFTGIFYGVFAYFREQACIAVCPYGRLQGVLLTKDSLVVAYDWLRGEPRGKIKKHHDLPETKSGDCIDCKLCVHVCPTGIDIRNGTQLECTNCTACMDACDEVMIKTGKPVGLIRYASYTGIKNGVQRIFTTRVKGYSVVLAALIGLLTYFVFTRADIETTVLRAPGTLYTRSDDGMISNVYNIEFVNKTFHEIQLRLKIENPSAAELQKIGDPSLVVSKESMLKGMFLVKIPQDEVRSMKMTIDIGVYELVEGEKSLRKIETVRARFVGPIQKFQ